MPRRIVHIVGAGPSGLAAAITVAKAGLQAVVHELSGDVGSRFHGDFQGLENWTAKVDVLEELADAGIEPVFEHIPISEQMAYGPDGSMFAFRSTDGPFYYLVRRGPQPGTVDRALLEQALAVGVDVRFHDGMQHLPEGGIVAHGPRGVDAIAVGYVFETQMLNGMFTAVDDALAPGGYAYLLVNGGRATLASCMFRDFHNEKTYLERTARFFQERLGFALEGGRRFGGRGNFSVPATAVQGGLIFAGEAIGFQDALWGFGMRFAMISGHLAAQSLVEGSPRTFDRRWEQRFGGVLRSAFVNRYLYTKFGHRGYQFMLQRLTAARSPRNWLREQYALSPWKRWLYPVAKRAVTGKRMAPTCAVKGCDCTWCRCHGDGLAQGHPARVMS